MLAFLVCQKSTIFENIISSLTFANNGGDGCKTAIVRNIYKKPANSAINMVFSLIEIGNILLIMVFVAYVLGDFVKPRVRVHPAEAYDPLAKYKSAVAGFNWEDFKFALLVTAPAVVFHELAHKFVAMGFGLNAHIEAWGLGIIIGVILKLIRSPFLILAPGYAAISGSAVAWKFSLIAFAGPAVNLLLWIGAAIVLKKAKKLSHKARVGLDITKKLNMLLFIFNMLPIAPLDGSKVFSGLFSLF